MLWLQRVCAFAALIGFPALAADQIVLTNGDTITGSIIKKDGARLTIKSEFLGEVSMPWSAVKSIKSDSELSVVLTGGETVRGKLASSGGQLQVVGTQTTTPLSAVSAVRNDAEQHNYERLQHPHFSELWVGALDFGLALARGNSRTDTLTTAATAARVTSTDKLSVYFNQIHGTARVNDLTSTIASAVRGGWKYNHNVSARGFLTGFDDYEHDRFQNLNFRLVAGLGAGYKVVKAERAQMDLDAGVDYLRENFMDGLHRNSSEGNFGDAFVLKISKIASVTQAARAFVNMQDRGAYRLNFDLQENTVLKKWLGWNVTASDRFLSNPVQGRQRNDLILSTGFRLTFAR
uniref:DUF481 domain-containing protein n=1 Tax=Solibacter usitatus (strain Ellin6076) TaxID=234267 RepID=Q01YX4_SOLUE